MAKPDIDDGWYKKSIELEAALDFADFTKYARVILRYAFSQLFGIGTRSRFVHLSCMEIAARVRCSRQVMFRARHELVVSGVLAPVEGQENIFEFNKDYESWVKVRRTGSYFKPASGPRLNAAEVADCRNAPAYWKGCKDTSIAHEVVNQSDYTVNQLVDKANSDVSTNRTTSCQPIGLQVVNQLVDKIGPPLEPPSRNRELENRERKQQRGREEAPLDFPGGRTPGFDTTTPDERASLISIGQKAADWFPNNDVIAKAIIGRDGGFSIPAYEAAAERMRTAPTSKLSRAYFLSIVSDFDRNGIPDDLFRRPSAPQAASGPRTAPMSYPERKEAQRQATRDKIAALKLSRSQEAEHGNGA